MEQNKIQRMWDIDTKSQLGKDITEEEKEFFNENYLVMVEEMKSDFEHWKYNTSKL